MKRLRQAIPSIIILAVLILIAVMFQPGPSSRDTGFIHMGTRFLIKTRDHDDELEAKAYQELDNLFASINTQWNPDWAGAIGTINSAFAAGKPATLPSELQPLFRRAQALAKTSQGYFDPGIGALTQAWGFSNNAEKKPSSPPPPATLQQLLAKQHSILQVTLHDDGTLTAPQGLRLDFGAFIKGYAVDAAIDHLTSLGIEHAIVDGGGDLKVLGNHVQRPWRLGVRNPKWKDSTSDVVRAAVQVEIYHGNALFTSGNYERAFEHEGQHYHHLLNPKTGQPVNDFASVSVVSNNGADADAAATALFVAGKAHWRKVAKAMQLKEFLLIDHDNNMIISKAMRDRSQIMLKDIEVETVDLDAPPPTTPPTTQQGTP